MANTQQPVHRAGPLVPAPTPLPPPDGPGAPPTEPVPHPPGAPGRAELPAAGPARPLAGEEPGGAATGPSAQHSYHGTAEGKQLRGQSRAGPHELQSGGLDGSLQAPRTGYRGRHHWNLWRRGQRNCCPTSPAETRGPASRPQRTPRRHLPRRSSCTSSQPRYWQTPGRVLSTTMARRRSQGAYKDRSAMRATCGTPHSASAPASGTRVAAHPLLGLSRGKRWCCSWRATRPSCTATL